MGTEGRCKKRPSEREAWKKSKELTYGRDRLSRCVEEAWNIGARKDAWKCGRKMSLKMVHARVLNARGTGEMCTE